VQVNRRYREQKPRPDASKWRRLGANCARLFKGVGGKPKIVGKSEEQAGPLSAGKRGMGHEFNTKFIGAT
jgi:hypothetical protein